VAAGEPKPWRLSTFECEMLLRWFLAHLDDGGQRALARELPTYYANLTGHGALRLNAEELWAAAAPTPDESTIATRLSAESYGSAGAVQVAARVIRGLGIPCVVRGSEAEGWRVVLGVPDARVRDVGPIVPE